MMESKNKKIKAVKTPVKKLGLEKLQPKKTNKPTKKIIKKKTVIKRGISKSKNIKDEINTRLNRSKENPIILPKEGSYWQSRATFNPTAFIADGKIHIIYRAIGDNDISALGYASSKDGISIDERGENILYSHQIKKRPTTNQNIEILYSSGGGTSGGAEDPRITLIDDHLYMIYTLFDGWGTVRMAITSISLEDFLNKYWVWKEPVLISPPGQINKNWVLFPEKINGKYAILHNLTPSIMIDYFDSLDELDGKNFIHSIHQGHSLWEKREKNIRGIGPAPIKTQYGWLIIYHAMTPNESHRYKLWAMLLDLKDPTKILYRSTEPILEPDEYYENNGFKSGVIYSCGAVVKDGVLFVYYGGADFVTCVATANLDDFLKELMNKKLPKPSLKKKNKL